MLMLLVALSMLIATAIIFFILPANEPGRLFGLFLPPEAEKTQEVQQLQSGYRKQLFFLIALFAVLAVPFLFIGKPFWIQFACLFVWEILQLIVCSLLFNRYVRKTEQLRAQKGWPLPNYEQISVDTSVSLIRKKLAVHPAAMLPGIILSLVPPLLWLFNGRDWTTLPAVFPGLLSAALFWAARTACIRARSVAYSENTDINRACHAVFVRGWTIYFAVASAVLAISLILLWLPEYFSGRYSWVTVLAVILLFLFIASTMVTVIRIRQKQQRILGMTDRYIPQQDDNQYWKGGFYNNPADPRLMVPKRSGLGMTFNVGNRLGKLFTILILGLSGLLVVGLIGMFAWMETAPFILEINAEMVTISAPVYGTEFPISEIREVSLTDSIPSGARTNGAAAGDLLLGHFRLDGVGDALLYVHTDQMPCIKIEMEEKTIYFTAETEEETAALLELLEEAVS